MVSINIVNFVTIGIIAILTVFAAKKALGMLGLPADWL